MPSIHSLSAGALSSERSGRHPSASRKPSPGAPVDLADYPTVSRWLRLPDEGFSAAVSALGTLGRHAGFDTAVRVMNQLAESER